LPFSKIVSGASVLLVFAKLDRFLLNPKKIRSIDSTKFAGISWHSSCADTFDSGQRRLTLSMRQKSVLAAGIKKMKNTVLQIAAIIMIGLALMIFAKSDHTWAQAQIRQSVERKFEEYRTAIKDAYKVDIKNFKDKIPGGSADGKAITNYDLKQLLEGIKSERDHTKDNLLALELAMDHLEYIPDYYRRLSIMERECASEKLLDR
jgi:hypothetical protein